MSAGRLRALWPNLSSVGKRSPRTLPYSGSACLESGSWSSALSPPKAEERPGAALGPVSRQPTQSLWAAVRTVFAAFADPQGPALPGRWNQGPLDRVSLPPSPGARVGATRPQSPGSRCIPSQLTRPLGPRSLRARLLMPEPVGLQQRVLRLQLMEKQALLTVRVINT